MNTPNSSVNYAPIVPNTAIGLARTSQHAEVVRDMALELYNILSEVGTSFFKARMYEEASKFLSRALDQAALHGWYPLDPHERQGLQLRFGVCFLELKRPAESEEVLVSVVVPTSHLRQPA